MSRFSSKDGNPYHAPGKGDGGYLQSCTEKELEQLANDPLCIEREKCMTFLLKYGKRDDTQNASEEERAVAIRALQTSQVEAKQRNPTENPFDARVEVSADAKFIAGRIVKNLWIIFVLLPVVLGILYAILTAK